MFRGIKFLPHVTAIDFVGQRFYGFALSIAILIGTIGLVSFKGLEFGIDFSGGIQMEVRADHRVDLAQLRTQLNALGAGEIELQGMGDTGREVMIRIPAFDDEATQNAALASVRESLGPGFEDRRTEVVGPKVGDELIRDGLLATLLAIAAIAGYVWLRFEWQFGVGAMLTLFHDVAATLGFYALTRLEFSLTSVAAVLTVAGYSINDTVVIYDRVRENLRKYKKMPILELLNLSVNETLSRTLLTGGTTILSVLAIALFGGEVLRGFALALIWGVVIGTFSSIYISLPVLFYFKLRDLDAIAPLEPEAAEGP